MAMRAATMPPLSPVATSTSIREPTYLFRKLVLLILLITATAAWIAVIFPNQIHFPLLLATFFADASLGLIAGFGAKFILEKQDALTQFLIGIVITLIGMTMLGFFTRSVLGIGPIELESRAAEQIRMLRVFDRDLVAQIRAIKIDSRGLLEFQKMDWADLVHLAISFLIAALALRAWPRPRESALQSVEVLPLPAPPTPRATRSRRSKRSRKVSSASPNEKAHVELPGSWSTRLRPNPSPAPGTRSNNGSHSPILKAPKKTRTKNEVVRPKRKRTRRKPQIQFALIEEHRCPYCLDSVTHNDPRGVKECDVCHTLHHADCWAITGFCQVPHLNT